MSFTSATVTVLLAMVALVVVTGALEAHTPAPRARPTKVTLPRRVEGPAEELPEVDLVRERRRYDRRLAARLASSRAVVDVAGRPSEVAPPELVPHELPTEAVPVVVLGQWLADDRVDDGARDVLAEIARSRMAPPEPWLPGEFSQQLIDPAVLGREVELEALLEAALARHERRHAATVAPGPVVEEPVVEGPVVDEPAVAVEPRRRSSTVFVASVERPGGTRVELGEPGKDRELVGVLFAAYVVGGFPERNRVTGWVTANGSPPSLPALSRGTKMRGRPARIADLLACSDEGRNWVTLDPSVAIERGLKARKPACEVLKGVLWWWLAATDERARIPGDHIAELRAGLEAVAPHVGTSPSADTVHALVAAAAEAAEAGVGLRVETVAASTLEREEERAPAEGAAVDGAPAEPELTAGIGALAGGG